MVKIMRLRRCMNTTVFGIALSALGLYTLFLRVQLQERSRSPNDEAKAENVHIVSKRSFVCDDEVVHLAVCVRSISDARQAAAMLKTVFHSRSVSLDLHVVVGSQLMFTTINTLLDTWELSRVKFAVHKVPEQLIDRRKWPLVKFMLHKLLPITLDRILYISNDIRLIDDVGSLWRHIFVDAGGGITSKNTIFTVSPVAGSNCSGDYESVCRHPYKVIGINLVELREHSTHDALLVNSSLGHLDSFLTTLKDRITTVVDCSWAVLLNATLKSTECLPAKGVIWTADIPLIHLEDEELERAKEIVMITATSEFIDGIHRKSLECNMFDSRIQKAPTFHDDCGKYRREARQKRRTHMYFHAGAGNEDNHDLVITQQKLMYGNGVDVTLATQLTINRFPGLERILAAWDGPASIVFYVKDDEVDRLMSLINGSSAMRGRTNVIYHVVYKRLLFNPMNYMRNIAVDHSYTSHVFYLDVDMVPSAGLHQQLNSWVKRFEGGKAPNSKAALIVPCFSSDTLITAPSEKSQLLQLMENGTVEGYKMKAAWTKGHAPTNFTHWVVADKPYHVVYKDGFEPYVVVRKDSSPPFNELMLERFADKALYIRELHAMGFKMFVLPDVFVTHLPHELSNVFALYLQHLDYSRCAFLILGEYKKELSVRFPEVVF